MSTTWRQRLQVVAGVLLLLLAAWLTIGGGDEGGTSCTADRHASFRQVEVGS